MTAAGTGDGGPQRPQAGPDDVAGLEQEIQQTRAALGETVAALAAKTDVRARAAGKARQLAGRLTQQAAHAGGGAASRAGQARAGLAGQAGRARAQLTAPAQRGRTLLGAAPQAGHRLGEQAAGRATAVARPARQAAQRAAAAVRQRPVPAAVVGGILILAILALVMRRRHR